MKSKSLEEILADLGPAYDKWKEGEKEKNKLKDEFFEEATRQNDTPAEQIVRVAAVDAAEAVDIASKRNPVWTVDEHREDPNYPGVYEIIMLENPKLMAFSFEYEGRTFKRQIQRGPSLLDDERLQEADPELWEAVTEVPTERQLLDIETLDPELVDRLQEYMYEGKPIVKFPAPSATKG